MDFFNTYISTQYRFVTDLSQEGFEIERKAFEEEFLRRLPQNKDVRILDVACGAGHFLYFLKHAGYHNYLGIDLSTEQIQFCQQHTTDKVVKAEAFEFLESHPESFDVIFSNNFIEHLDAEQLNIFSQLLVASLKKGGMAIMRTINMWSPFALGSFYSDITHKVGFTEVSMAQFLRLGGFSDVEVSPSHCRWSLSVILRFYRLLVFSFGKRPAKIVSPNIIGIGRKS